jgi:hypothetical protein
MLWTMHTITLRPFLTENPLLNIYQQTTGYTWTAKTRKDGKLYFVKEVEEQGWSGTNKQKRAVGGQQGEWDKRRKDSKRRTEQGGKKGKLLDLFTIQRKTMIPYKHINLPNQHFQSFWDSKCSAHVPAFCNIIQYFLNDSGPPWSNIPLHWITVTPSRLLPHVEWVVPHIKWLWSSELFVASGSSLAIRLSGVTSGCHFQMFSGYLQY